MKAAVLQKIQVLTIEERPQPHPGPGEVSVRVRAVGVCGSDVHYYQDGRIGTQVVTAPLVLGHECAGEIAEIGEGVTDRHVGQRVAVEPGVPCRHCDMCKIGKYNLCYDMVFLGTPPIDGAYREYVVTAADFAHPIPDSMRLDQAAMCEPLAVGLHAVNLSGMKPGDSVAVLGAGSIGLYTLQCAMTAGAGATFVTDPLRYRLDIAKRLGAGRTLAPEEATEAIMEATGGSGVDVVFEAAGALDTPQQCFDIAARGGTVVFIGICSRDVQEVQFGIARRKELTIKLVRRFANVYPRSVALAAGGRVDLQCAITHHFPLGDIAEAFRLVENYEDGVVKAIIEM